MTISDMDWGDTQWEVDAKAESLNKSLFGNKKANAHIVKADPNLSDKTGTTVNLDSDDDEKFSKKAKKKLKERKRKENKRNKKNDIISTDDNGQSISNVGNEKQDEEDKVQTKSKKTTKQKQKGKTDDTKPISNSKVKDAQHSKTMVDKNKVKDAVKKKKRKNSVSVDECEETTEKTKQKKIEDKNPDLNNEGEPSKKRKRKKKKKPNSKKNKYKHLGLKSQKVPECDSDDETDDSDKKDNVKSEKHSVSDDGLKSTKSKKRKKSLSEEEQLPAKKTKLMDNKLENGSPTMKSRKEKKLKKLQETKITKDTIDKTNVDKAGKKLKANKTEPGAKSDGGGQGKINNGKKVKSDENKSEKFTSTTLETKTASKKLKKEKNGLKKNDSKNKVDHTEKDKVNEIEETSKQLSKSSPFFSSSQGNELQQKMMEKLSSARFRFINEQLYTIKGGEAFRMFQQDKTLMDAYNAGFQGQVKQWSVNPLDVIIKQLSTKQPNLSVVDFGCGEARLSSSVPQKVKSFDLCALNERVTVCDMSKTPLASNSIDIAVFCLSLMGTNLNDYILEANRILKEGGLLKIAEVVSRFTNPTHFINAVSSMGFKAVNTRELSTMFYLMDFKKVKSIDKNSKQTKTISLKPCVYKKR